MDLKERWGYRRALADGGSEYLILPQTFNTVFCRGLDRRTVIAALENAGYLQTEAGSGCRRRLPATGSRQMRFYIVSDAILAGEV